jgi:hypothetical protein
MKPLKQRLREIGLIEIQTGDVNERVWIAYKGKTTVMVHRTRGTTTFRIKVSKNGKDQDFVRHNEEEALILLASILGNEMLQFYVMCGVVIVCALAYATVVLSS